MVYGTQGKTYVIPDNDVDHIMKKYGLQQQQAIELWLQDNDYLDCPAIDELTEKAKANRRYEKSDAPRKDSTRERKVDEIKAKFLQILMDSLKNEVHITGKKNEAEFAFEYENNKYTVKLIKHRGGGG